MNFFFRFVFFFFCGDERLDVRVVYFEWFVVEVVKELGKRWEKVINRFKFEVRVEADKVRYVKVGNLGYYIFLKR